LNKVVNLRILPGSISVAAIVRPMNPRRLVTALGLTLSLVCAGGVLASASANSAIHDGYYSRHGFGAGYSYVGLMVGDDGHVLLGGQRGSGVACTVSAALTAQDPNEFTSITVISIFLPRNLPISANGTFSFSGNVTLTPEDTQTSMSFVEPITLTGHFKLGTVKAFHGVAVTGTFSSPAICEPQTPTTYADEWVVNDK
jgi:hypothetical protein